MGSFPVKVGMALTYLPVSPSTPHVTPYRLCSMFHLCSYQFSNLSGRESHDIPCRALRNFFNPRTQHPTTFAHNPNDHCKQRFLLKRYQHICSGQCQHVIGEYFLSWCGRCWYQEEWIRVEFNKDMGVCFEVAPLI